MAVGEEHLADPAEGLPALGVRAHRQLEAEHRAVGPVELLLVQLRGAEEERGRLRTSAALGEPLQHLRQQRVALLLLVEDAQPLQRTIENNQVWEAKSNITSRLPKWKVDEMLNHYVNGEAYFIGDLKKVERVSIEFY